MKNENFGVQYSDDGKVLLLFPGDKLGEYIIPHGVEKISSYSFSSECRFISKLILSDTILCIDHRAFDGCKIGELYISKSVKYIESGAFGNNEIGTFIIDDENPNYRLYNGNNIVSADNGKLIKWDSNSIIPREVKQIGTFSISVFRSSKPNILIIPEGVERLCAVCITPYINSNLELRLPSTIKRIEYQEWTDDCDCMTRIVVPKGQKKRFSRMKNLQYVKHIIVEADE